MRKSHIDPHQLVDRLEKKYQKKTRFQKYKSLTQYFRETVLRIHDSPAHNVKHRSHDMFDYEYIG